MPTSATVHSPRRQQRAIAASARATLLWRVRTPAQARASFQWGNLGYLRRPVAAHQHYSACGPDQKKSEDRFQRKLIVMADMQQPARQACGHAARQACRDLLQPGVQSDRLLGYQGELA